MLNFIYFLIFLVPGLFAVLLQNLLCRSRMECWKAAGSALMYDLLILAINLAGLSYFKGICTFCEFQGYLQCLRFTSKYIFLSIIVGIVLAISAWLLSKLFVCCKKHFHCRKSCNEIRKS
ncbi:hypothetical protein [Clostridium sp. JN-9]|uniref:hypothetical protein n=1 Tax=Clostridium sp. JN-9 TaxID=2507159 RepID=UPI000FFE28A7|nr:hypothetical protein [Clostridium sp. JN-9]QAT41087.1 hypothetical protein EQM05_12900 [Clostridium sp. JN-9]